MQNTFVKIMVGFVKIEGDCFKPSIVAINLLTLRPIRPTKKRKNSIKENLMIIVKGETKRG